MIYQNPDNAYQKILTTYGDSNGRFYGTLSHVLQCYKDKQTLPRLGYPKYDLRSNYLFPPLRMTSANALVLLGLTTDDLKVKTISTFAEDPQTFVFKTIDDFEKLDSLQFICDTSEKTTIKLLDFDKKELLSETLLCSKGQLKKAFNQNQLSPFSDRRGDTPFIITGAGIKDVTALLFKYDLTNYELLMESPSPRSVVIFEKKDSQSFDGECLRHELAPN
jgi:hypothetical protein